MIKDEVLRSFSGKNCLVTGGTGMIGREIAILLANAGAHVRVVSLDKVNIHGSIEHVYGDLTDFEFCKEQTRDMDCVFHVAGIKGSIKVTVENPASFFVPLLMFNTNVLEASRLNKVPKLVYTSSIGAYSASEIFIESEEEDLAPPMDMYPGWAKRMAEMQIQAYRTQYGLENYSVVRPCNVYGPGDNFGEWSMVIPSLIKKAHENDVIEVWGDGSPIRDFIHCRDVANGMIHMVENGVTTPVNLGSGLKTSIKDIATIISKYTNKPLKFNVSRNCGDSKRLMDMSRSTQCGFTPSISLEDGIIETIEWYREHVL